MAFGIWRELVNGEVIQNSRFFRIINEDVVWIYHYTDIQQVLEDCVHKVLEGGRSFGETSMHDKGFVGAVSCAKSGLPSVLLRLCRPSRKWKVHLGKGMGWSRLVK